MKLKDDKRRLIRKGKEGKDYPEQYLSQMHASSAYVRRRNKTESVNSEYLLHLHWLQRYGYGNAPSEGPGRRRKSRQFPLLLSFITELFSVLPGVLPA